MVRRRRQRQRSMPLMNAVILIEDLVPCFIKTLPNEIILQVISHLTVSWSEYSSDLTPESARDLARVARTCRRFYPLAMCTLWHKVKLWPIYEWQSKLSAYPSASSTASKRALSFVRNMRLSVHVSPNDSCPTRSDFEVRFDYVSGCFRLLKGTKAIDTMYLDVGLYDPTNHYSDCNDIIESINGTALRILKRVSRMKLQELEFGLSRGTARIEYIMSIIGKNADKLWVCEVPVARWAPHLHYFTKLRSLSAQVTRRNLQAEATFWTSLSHLPNLKSVQLFNLPPTLDLCLPYLIDLELDFTLDMDYAEWTHSLMTILKQMPALEDLELTLYTTCGEREAMQNNQITTVACANLKTLSLSCPIPRGLISTIATHCQQLTKVFVSVDNIEDEDLHQLSLSCPNLREIYLRKTKLVTRLDYFSAFQHLEVLEVYYLAAKFIDRPLVVKLVNSCPKLNQIKVSDNQTPLARRTRGQTEFEETPLEELFPTFAEPRSYFEPKISKGHESHRDGLIEYAIRIDRLREDLSQPQHLTK